MSEERRITKEYLLEHFEDNEMDLSMTNISRVPVRELAQIPRMTRLDLSRNHLTSLPDNFSSLKTVVELDLSNNQLTELPANFGEMTQLQKLDLYSNKLTDLPLSFAELEKLWWLDLKNNPLSVGLAKVAGTCVNEAECKECAKNVMVYMIDAATEAERKKKRNMERKLARERKKHEEEMRKKEEARREKQELKRRRREEREREEQARRETEEQSDSQGGDTASSTGEGAQETSTQDTAGKRSSCRCCCFLLGFYLLVFTVLAVLTLCFTLYCDSVLTTAVCEEVQRNISANLRRVLQVTRELTGLPVPVL